MKMMLLILACGLCVLGCANERAQKISDTEMVEINNCLSQFTAKMKRRDVDLLLVKAVNETNINSLAFGISFGSRTEEFYRLKPYCSVTLEFAAHSTNAFDPEDTLLSPPQYFSIKHKTFMGGEQWSKIPISAMH